MLRSYHFFSIFAHIHVQLFLTMRKFISTILLVLLGAASSFAAEPIKNIIYLIGDGMGLTSASMMQIEGSYAPTIFDRADNVALITTYSNDNRVTDSAAAGTALATGHKTNNTYLGVSPDGTPLESLTTLAQRQDMATGVVVTTYLQHATPGAFYAHTTSRHDYNLITEQLAESNFDVAIGGGMELFRDVYGSEEAAIEHLMEQGFGVARTMEQLASEDGAQRVIALLADKEIGAYSGTYLADATREALRLVDLRDNDNGFVIMVEGSLIDGMGHGNDAQGMQAEMVSFMAAIEVAVEYAERNEGTLVVVTADHETGGMSVVSNNSDFNLSEQGVEYRFSTDGHSGVMVPVYLYGDGAERINGVLDNATLGAMLKSFISK